MRVPILVTLTAAGLLAACSERLGPDPNQPAELVSAAKRNGGLSCPDGPASWAFGVNSAGRIVGAVESQDEENSFACLWDSKTGTGIQLGTMYWASAINASGQVVGGGSLWDKGVITDLGIEARGINNKGQVVGTSTQAFGQSPRAFLWYKGVLTDLGTLPGAGSSSAHGINEAGQVVGTSGDRAFLWDKGRMVDLGTLGGAQSVARGINAAGKVVGAAQTATGEWHAVIWYRGTTTDLGPGLGRAINNAGVVVGSSGDTAVFWRKGVMTRLAVPEEEDDYYYATAISESGVVVGVYVFPYSSVRMIWTIK
jgi:probable HAF family extracellular repeat protein